MNYLKLFEQYNNNIYYHHTKSENLNNILSNGLKIYSNTFKSGNTYEDSIDYIKSLYNGIIPIFLTSNKNLFYKKGDVRFEVNINGLDAVSDIPSFDDYMNSISEFWTNHKLGYKITDDTYLEEIYDIINTDSIITYESLLNDKKVIEIVSYLTQSVAILSDIPSSRIKVI